MTEEHVPVLADEVLDLVDPRPGETIVDGTFGSGGHARRLAERIGPGGTLIAIDRDPAAERRYGKLATGLGCRSRFVRADFATVLRNLAAAGEAVDAVLLDLGVSSMQVDAAERGFSYSYDAPLDMRMDPGQETDAREVVNSWPEARLAEAIRELGEERYAKAIAREIVRRRPFDRTGELATAVRDAVPPRYRFGRGHPAKRTFQAIRIVVNGELENLDAALPAAWELLAEGGRLAVISFHSLEDRRVKRFLADRARGCVCPPELPVCRCGRRPDAQPLHRGAVKPGPEELERNPRSGSARLRVSRKLPGTAGPAANAAAEPRN